MQLKLCDLCNKEAVFTESGYSDEYYEDDQIIDYCEDHMPEHLKQYHLHKQMLIQNRNQYELEELITLKNSPEGE